MPDVEIAQRDSREWKSMQCTSMFLYDYSENKIQKLKNSISDSDTAIIKIVKTELKSW